MTTRKERLHRIWEKLEHTMQEQLHVVDELGEALSEARNQEQIEILREQTGIVDLLHEVSGVLLKIQQNNLVPQLWIEDVDRLADEVREILDNGLQAGAER